MGESWTDRHAADRSLAAEGSVIEDPLRIALFTHSVNPRGGVVHTLELAEALHDAGHHVTVFAPALPGQMLFRAVRCAQVLVPVPETTGGLDALVEQRVAALVERLPQWLAADAAGQRFDVLHAQDGITANALATLAEQGVIPRWVRTVHHLDRFPQARLQQRQLRGFARASSVYVVSPLWRDTLRRDYGVPARVVPNGVNLQRYTPRLQAERGADELALAVRLGIRLDAGPVFLAVGGVEGRKNTHRILQAYALRHAQTADTAERGQLVIAGGATLLDHGDEQARYAEILAESGLREGPRRDVLRTGPLADVDMPVLFRLADALLMPSVNEGFGLVVLEALASGTPAVVSRIEPFTGYLGEDDVSWCDPLNVDSLVTAMNAALQRGRPPVPTVCQRFSWARSAELHVAWYRLDCPPDLGPAAAPNDDRSRPRVSARQREGTPHAPSHRADVTVRVPSSRSVPSPVPEPLTFNR